MFRRGLLVALIVLATGVLPVAQAQKVPKNVNRLGLESDFEVYPQSTPKELLASVAKAIGRERYDYLAAHLMDPPFIDMRVQRASLKLDELAAEMKAKFTSQPEVTKDLLKLLGSGDLADGGLTAVVTHKDVKQQQVFLKKIGDRWFIENRQKDDKTKE